MNYLSLRVGDSIEEWEPLTVFLTFLLVQAIVIPRNETRLGHLYFCMSFWTPFISVVAALLFVYPIGLSEIPTLSGVAYEWSRLMLIVPLPSLLASTAVIHGIAWLSDQIRGAGFRGG